MSPFDPNFKSSLVAEMLTPRGRRAARASRQASARIDAMRASDDPLQRANASGTIPGLGQQPDHAKTSRILKPAKL
ncbi:hypothetical protein [Roseateles sp.]|uniref:hypothetical protein n=1 Tax=Roseateles sp. TaxID=1971397 RepID=UPI003BA9D4B4